MQKKSNKKRVAALFIAVVMGLTAVPAQAIWAQDTGVPTNFRFEYSAGGTRELHPYTTQNAGIGPVVENAHRALVWDAVADATGYRVYAFTSAAETNPANAYRVQEVLEPRILIGHDSVTQARTRVNPIVAGCVCTTLDELCAYGNAMPVNADGYLSWGSMVAANRQCFDLPLPFRVFYFRVVALGATNSAMSDYVRAYPGARSVSPAQSAALIEDARARGAAYPYFIFVQVGNLGAWSATGYGMVGVAGRLHIMMSNTPTPLPDHFGENFNGPSNRDFVERAAIEFQNHPAYIGAETLVLLG
ncbi:MAG: hypothetical protein FWB74_09570 [Defluviitaleaceae bacterium]|nr:hypothetical protein [Defluviitaleaceae bacterium]